MPLCISICVYQAWKNMSVLLHPKCSIGSFDWKSVFFCGLSPVLGIWPNVWLTPPKQSTAQLYTTRLANSWPTNLGLRVEHKHVDGETKDSNVLEFHFRARKRQSINSVSSWQKKTSAISAGLSIVSFHKRQTSAAWHSRRRQNKSTVVTWSRVPFHTLDDNNQLNWNPFCLLLTRESLSVFSSLSSQWSNQETASWSQDSGFGYAHGGSAGAALTRQINSVVRKGSAEVQATAALL